MHGCKFDIIYDAGGARYPEDSYVISGRRLLLDAYSGHYLPNDGSRLSNSGQTSGQVLGK
jgi:hypothetical protein